MAPAPSCQRLSRSVPVAFPGSCQFPAVIPLLLLADFRGLCLVWESSLQYWSSQSTLSLCRDSPAPSPPHLSSSRMYRDTPSPGMPPTAGDPGSGLANAEREDLPAPCLGLLFGLEPRRGSHTQSRCCWGHPAGGWQGPILSLHPWLPSALQLASLHPSYGNEDSRACLCKARKPPCCVHKV